MVVSYRSCLIEDRRDPVCLPIVLVFTNPADLMKCLHQCSNSLRSCQLIRSAGGRSYELTRYELRLRLCDLATL